MRESKSTMFLSKISIHSCVIIYRGRKAFRTAEKLKHHIKDCFKINGKQTIKMPKRGEYIKFKNFGRKIISPFTIYADFTSILVPEDNEKQNPNESYTNKKMLLVVIYIN